MGRFFLNRSIIALSWVVFGVAILYISFRPPVVIAASTIEVVANLPLHGVQKSKLVKPVKSTDLECLSENIYYEASNQSYIGKLAVGQVVLNRTKNPQFPSSVCEVVHQSGTSKTTDNTVCQFSWVCDAERQILDKSSYAWKQSREVALSLLSINIPVKDITEGALYFHTTHVKPDWASRFKKVAKIDDHLFYR